LGQTDRAKDAVVRRHEPTEAGTVLDLELTTPDQHRPKILLPFKRGCNYNVVIVADILGSFEQAVLLAIVRLESGAYGRAILKEVQVRLERDVAAGAVQATLERLERKGLVRSKVGSGTPIRDGRARRFYTVLSDGLRALDDARKTHETIWRGFSRPMKARS
jgi:DNA-binding PadR family transcriptional regulator